MQSQSPNDPQQTRTIALLQSIITHPKPAGHRFPLDAPSKLGFNIPTHGCRDIFLPNKQLEEIVDTQSVINIENKRPLKSLDIKSHPPTSRMIESITSFETLIFPSKILLFLTHPADPQTDLISSCVYKLNPAADLKYI